MKKILISILASLTLTACAAETKPAAPTEAPRPQAEKTHADKAHKGDKGQKGEKAKGKKRDLSGAAATLGVSEADLRKAMRESGRPPNLAQAAASLGISEADLKAALPAHPKRPRPDGPKGDKPKSTGS